MNQWRNPMLISFLYLLLNIAIIVFVALIIVWLLRVVGISIDGNVYRAGQIIVVLLIVIAVAMWLMGSGPSLRWS